MTAPLDSVTPESIERLQAEAIAEIQAAGSPEVIERLRSRYLGRRGLLRQASSALGAVPAEKRPLVGRALNEARRAIEEALRQKSAVRPPAPQEPPFDFTMPGRPRPRGGRHPITATIEAIRDIFARLGFEVAFGPEAELDYYNFEALNIPPDHPARDAFDTFFLETGALLRSQTSTVQIRVMEKRTPPIRVIAPGKVYRPDTVDATHSFLFHQIEGLAVEEGITMADLKYVLHEFARGFFGKDVRMRFRPSFFPFTEPSVEVDITCFACNGSGCALCKRAGWIEILGAGMVDPNVFEVVGYDPERYTGFAFGMGVERIAMLRHRIDDMRLFLENDLRFLGQF